MRCGLCSASQSDLNGPAAASNPARTHDAVHYWPMSMGDGGMQWRPPGRSKACLLQHVVHGHETDKQGIATAHRAEKKAQAVSWLSGVSSERQGRAGQGRQASGYRGQIAAAVSSWALLRRRRACAGSISAAPDPVSQSRFGGGFPLMAMKLRRKPASATADSKANPRTRPPTKKPDGGAPKSWDRATL